ncbi:MAG: sensor histidine kinase [Acidobacteriota bacterium]
MKKLLCFHKYWQLLVAVNFAAAIVAMLVNVLFGSVHSLAEARTTFVECVIYSFCIGTLAGVSLPPLGLHSSQRSLAFKLVAVGGILVLATVVGCAIADVLIVLAGLESAATVTQRFLPLVRMSVLIALAAGFGIFLYESMKSRVERAKQLATEAQLSSLESRVHPHFLFNTLNSIASLIHDDPRKAEEIVGRLAALLRFSLDANQSSLVPLEREIKIVRDYLEIEKARFGERLRYSIDVPRELESTGVPPLGIESLVENSVKHVIAKRREGGEVRVSARPAAGGGVEIEVADSGPGFALASAPPGHGIDNLKARLDALYDGRAKFEAAGPIVRLLIPEEA